MLSKNFIYSLFDKFIYEINQPYFKDKFKNDIGKPIVETIIKKCYPVFLVLIILYMILVILLIIIIIFLISKKKNNLI